MDSEEKVVFCVYSSLCSYFSVDEESEESEDDFESFRKCLSKQSNAGRMSRRSSQRTAARVLSIYYFTWYL